MRILGFGAMSFIRRAIKKKKDHPVKPVGIVNRSHLGFSAANFSAGSYNSVAIQQWLFSGRGNCPARLQLLAVREGYTKRLCEPDQKAQSPLCCLQLSRRVFYRLKFSERMNSITSINNVVVIDVFPKGTRTSR